jgi:hypothetical protein
MKFQNQLLAVAKAMEKALYRYGNISDITAQTIGPQVLANPTMKRQAKTIMTVPEDFISDASGGVAIDAGWNLK